MNRKPIFDAVRHLLGRSFRTAEVTALDAAIDAALSADTVRRIGPDGIALIQGFEGCAKKRADGSFEAYPDPGTGSDPWTIGWGATGKGIGPGTIWTQAQCDARLEADLARYSADVARALGDAPNQPAAVRCAGQLPLQHRRDRPGHADQAAQGRRSCRRGG
jgi:lysozyme